MSEVRSTRARRTRSNLLEAARAGVRDKGLSATSREITAAAGANLAAITYHFGSKEQLVAEALLDGLRAWLKPALEELSGDGDPATRTLAAIDRLITTFEQHRDAAPVYLEALVQAPRIPYLRRGVLELWSELRHSLAEQMTTMKARAELPDWVEPTPMAALLVAVANGLALHVSVDPAGASLGAMAAQFGSLLLAARSGPTFT